MTEKEENIENENIEADVPVETEPVVDTETEPETTEPETEPVVEPEGETKTEEDEVFKEANKDTMEEVKEFHEKKETIEKEKEDVKETPKAKPKRTFDLAHLSAFKERLIADFGLEEKTNERKRTALKLNGKTVIRFIPRKRVWYAVKHYDTQMKRIMYYTVESEEQETEHYEFVKARVATLQETPKEA